MFPGRDLHLITQEDTYAPIVPSEDDGTLDDASNHRILWTIVERIARECSVGGRLVLVDSLHATHCVRVGALSVDSFETIDREVCRLGAMAVVLRLSEDSIRRRTIIGRRHTGFYRYAGKFGANEDELTAYFFKEQTRLIELMAEHSGLRPIVLDGDVPPDELRQQFAELVLDYLRHGDP